MTASKAGCLIKYIPTISWGKGQERTLIFKTVHFLGGVRKALVFPRKMETVFDTPKHAALLTRSFITSSPALEVFLNTKITGPRNYVEDFAFNSKHESLRGEGKPFGEWPAQAA